MNTRRHSVRLSSSGDVSSHLSEPEKLWNGLPAWTSATADGWGYSSAWRQKGSTEPMFLTLSPPSFNSNPLVMFQICICRDSTFKVQARNTVGSHSELLSKAAQSLLHDACNIDKINTADSLAQVKKTLLGTAFCQGVVPTARVPDPIRLSEERDCKKAKDLIQEGVVARSAQCSGTFPATRKGHNRCTYCGDLAKSLYKLQGQPKQSDAEKLRELRVC